MCVLEREREIEISIFKFAHKLLQLYVVICCIAKRRHFSLASQFLHTT